MEDLSDITDDEDFLELIEIVENPRKTQVFREKPNHFEKWDEAEFIQRFRISKASVRILLEEIKINITLPTNRNHALAPADMLLVALRFFATGSLLQVVGDFSGIDKSTASRANHKVARAIAQCSRNFIKLPQTNAEILAKRQGFFNISRFPRCIGALDCTHIKILSPGGQDPENYRNRKGFFSMNVQAICDSELIFENIVCRWPGASHDSTIFNNSVIRAQFENGEYGDNLLVGDSGYAIKPYLITPLANPRNPEEHLFNEAQIRTRNPIERCFGVWKRRFPILAFGIRVKLGRVEAIVVATAVLHNIARLMHDAEPILNAEEETAVHFVNDIGNMSVRDICGINNSTRNALITEYFARL